MMKGIGISQIVRSVYFAGAVLALVAVALSGRLAEKMPASYGLAARIPAKAYLNLPDHANGVFPRLLSQTGVFKNTPECIPNEALIPYDLIVPFWSDGAVKTRWVAVPDATIKFSPGGEWAFPRGTVFVKMFDLPVDETNPSVTRRLETRLLVCDEAGGVYGLVYKWRADNSDADLLDAGLTEAVSVKTAGGSRTQMWVYPSRQDCLVCHTANAGLVLGVKTRQLNRTFTYPSGVSDNELRAWNHIGLFDSKLNESNLIAYPTLARADDASRSLEDRARSYLDVNCAGCHRPGGTVAYFDARYDTPLIRQNLIDGPVLIDQRIDNPRIVAPNDIWRSILFMRANTTEAFKMPQLAHNELDRASMDLLRKWIESLPGQPVLPPPVISPRGGTFSREVEVTLTSEPGATIRYTLNGTVPTKSDLLYEKPVLIKGPTFLRAKAFKPGFKKSITVQEIYIVGE
ncbi:MAG: chitobiase/beta-hexosaminidase C-terminal domain-containing protein [Planctomycetota bacterium]